MKVISINNFIYSSGSGNRINYGSGSDFLPSYGSGSTNQKVTDPTVPVPVPQHCRYVSFCISNDRCATKITVVFRIHNIFMRKAEEPEPDPNTDPY